MPRLRIQKYLSEMSVASRRMVEQMIIDGRITVNGQLVTSLPCFVEPEDDIRIDGRPIRKRPPKRVSFLLNKPSGVVCTQRDVRGRPRATDLVPDTGSRLHCIGGLEADSTGLIILTNDGELTEYLTRSRHGLEKTEVVEIDGQMSGEDIETLKKGVYVEDKKIRVAQVKVLKSTAAASVLEIKLTQPPKGGLRRLLSNVGYKVRKHRRTAIGPITDKRLKVGYYRLLGADEIEKLKRHRR